MIIPSRRRRFAALEAGLQSVLNVDDGAGRRVRHGRGGKPRSRDRRLGPDWRSRQLGEGVGRHSADTVWATRTFKDAAERVQGCASLSMVADAAAELIPGGE